MPRSGLFPSGILTKFLCITRVRHTCYMPRPYSLDFIVIIIYGEVYASSVLNIQRHSLFFFVFLGLLSAVACEIRRSS